jgi:hypothetical protein
MVRPEGEKAAGKRHANINNFRDKNRNVIVLIRKMDEVETGYFPQRILQAISPPNVF